MEQHQSLKRYYITYTVFKKILNSSANVKNNQLLLFDHIGGINTLFHTLYNNGTVIVPKNRSIETVLKVCDQYKVELLPTTPTFLRLLLIGGFIPDQIPSSIKIITYGTERMDQITLDKLCSLLPKVDFRQTYGMSELEVFLELDPKQETAYL